MQRPSVTFRNMLFLRWGVVSPNLNPQAGLPPLVDCPWLLIQYILSYPPYMEAFSSIPNLRTRHAVVTRDLIYTDKKIFSDVKQINLISMMKSGLLHHP
jgi:hypothetical protein